MIPTAEELFLSKNLPKHYCGGEFGLYYIKKAMIEFAKLHVEEQKKDIIAELRRENTSDSHIESIVNNAYPLTNIK
jgi:hypothetical protein